MNRVIFMVLAISVVLASGMIGSRPAQDEACVPGELVVFFVDDGGPALSLTSSAVSAANPSVDRVLRSHGLTGARALFGPHSRLRNAYLLRFPPQARIEAIITALEHLPSVRSVTRNWKLHPAFTPDDYYYNNDTNSDGRLDQWVFQRTQLDRAWDVTQGDTSVVVALIDTGFDLDHADLNGVVWVNSGETPDNDTDDDSNGYVDDVYGYDFFDGDSDPSAEGEGSHGTVIGSIIAAETNTGGAYGVAGASWESRIMVLRVGDQSGFDFEDIIEAINYAIDNGADIINMSFFTSLDITQLETAVASADTAGLVLVAAAGDSDTESARYPGSYSEVIRVAAVDSATAKTDDSNYGSDVFIVAPSAESGYPEEGIVTCDYDTSSNGSMPGDQKPHVFAYTDVQTSGAAAQVTGAVALLKARYPSASKDFIVGELARGATAVSDALYAQGKLGAGMVNGYRSVTQWGTVARDTTWSSLAFVSGDLTVASAETLRVAPGTTVYVATDDNEGAGTYTSRVEFTVNGYLDCVGTAANPIVFEGFETSDRDAWLGIKVTSSALGARFEHVVIRNAETGIEHWVPVTASQVRIEDCEVGIESLEDLTISQSYISSVTDYGIYLRRGEATLTSDTLTGGDQTGFYAGQYSSNDSLDVEITNCVISDNDFYGVQCGSGVRSLDISGTTISGNNWGVLATGQADIAVSGTMEYNDAYGVFTTNTTTGSVGGTISDNTTAGVVLGSTAVQYLSGATIEDNGTGVLVTGSGVNPTILSNTIQSNSTGIRCDGSATGLIGFNAIKSNGTGIMALNSGLPNAGNGQLLSGSNVLNRNTWDVSNLNTGTTLMAEDNCWNLQTGPKLIGTGSVDTDPHGTSCPSGTGVSPWDGEESEDPALPTRYAITGTHPNPFNPTVTVSYDVPAPGGRVRIQVYDVAGRLVSRLVDGEHPAGRHGVTWNGQSQRGGPVASGVYFVKMTARNFGATRKIVFLK